MTAVFWTQIHSVLKLAAAMGRELRIRVAFERSRLGAEHLRRAYELVVPVHRRSCDSEQAEEAAGLQEQRRAKNQTSEGKEAS